MQYTWLVATVTIETGYTFTNVCSHTSSPILTKIFRTEGFKTNETKKLQYKFQTPYEYHGIANNINKKIPVM